eukprot:g21536.t1
MDATRPPVLPKSRHGSDAWFEERGLEPVFPQLAAWSLPFDRVVVLDAAAPALRAEDRGISEASPKTRKRRS